MSQQWRKSCATLAYPPRVGVITTPAARLSGGSLGPFLSCHCIDTSRNSIDVALTKWIVELEARKSDEIGEVSYSTAPSSDRPDVQR